jgi:SSS family solute:Na+ symporter
MLTPAIIVGILFIGALGVLGRKRQREMAHWTVGGRDLPKWTSWFLQAGESLTTFSFLGLAGVAYGGGVSALFALVYLSSCRLRASASSSSSPPGAAPRAG